MANPLKVERYSIIILDTVGIDYEKNNRRNINFRKRRYV